VIATHSKTGHPPANPTLETAAALGCRFAHRAHAALLAKSICDRQHRRVSARTFIDAPSATLGFEHRRVSIARCIDHCFKEEWEAI
jgi:hypothetical protein